ncbi:hypothetical protein [Oryza sativa Japonica Group]|uniref:Uncharacterized protein n=1 Tax=Oryza sativa subsp. japonica TaxID=39947 RepID=Q5Z8C2_ORYSJ|nr:hypothetical protein [Oryza sativa Japonica Group]BAD53956.1 hypothetical protein [Oryza sativa Japonica Group]
MEEGEDAGRRRWPWRCSPAHDAEWVPAAESDGRGVDGVTRTTANATRLGAVASGGRSGGGGGGKEGDGARAMEGTGTDGTKRKRERGGGEPLYRPAGVDRGWDGRDFAGGVGRGGEEREAGFKN